MKTFTTYVVSCDPSRETHTVDGSTVTGFDVILEDTILFPTGGGQPSDRGTMNGLPVLAVRREYAVAVHFVQMTGEQAFQPGQSVLLELNWPLRHDQMQQHSGQHLVTAIFEQHYGWDTVAWNMGAETSFVRLDAKSVSAEQLLEAEQRMNDIIADGCPVTVQTVDPTANTANGSEPTIDVTRATRGLPKDHVGAVRIVTFAGIESNMCCGTHVLNLSQLQAVKLLHAEPSKGTVLVHFVVGGRVLRSLQRMYERERTFNVLLGGAPDVHVELLQNVQDKLKQAQRSVKRLHKDLAAAEARQVPADRRFWCVHRKDGQDVAYLQALQAALAGRKDLLLFGTTGEERLSDGASGKVVMQGRTADVDALAPIVADLLECAGAGKNGRYQGRANNMRGLKVCEQRIGEYFEALQLE